MKITQMRLTNFKIFDEISLDLKPITLLTGVNSSGKSALSAGLASMLQTSQPHMFPFEIVLNGENCSLGSYVDVARGHTTKTNFGFGFSAEHDGKEASLDVSFRYSPRGDHILPNSINFRVADNSLKIVWNSSKRKYDCHIEAPSLAKMKDDKVMRAFISSLAIYMREKAKAQSRSGKRAPMELEKTFFPKTPIQEQVLPMGASPRDLADRIASIPMGNYLIYNLREFVGKVKNHVGYVGPIRATPLRYYAPDRPHFSVDPQGINCAQLLHDWRKHSKAKFRRVAELLTQLELVQRVHLQTSADEILKIIVQPFSRPEESNFADVGYGVSQALPVVVSDVALPAASVLLINQPEVHLHPTSQANLANYFISRLDQRQYIIETHSEYIINRFRVLAAKGEMDPNMVSIVFLKASATDPNKVEKHIISLNKDGSLENAPKEFFQTYYVDSFDLAMGKRANEE